MLVSHSSFPNSMSIRGETLEIESDGDGDDGREGEQRRCAICISPHKHQLMKEITKVFTGATSDSRNRVHGKDMDEGVRKIMHAFSFHDPLKRIITTL